MVVIELRPAPAAARVFCWAQRSQVCAIKVTDMSSWNVNEKRIRKLEARHKIDDRIAVYVDDESQLATRIDELIAVGALAETDRPRCAFYLKIRHASRWQSTDPVALRLKAQKAIWTPCATWRTAKAHAEASPAGEPESAARKGHATDAR